MSHAPLFSLRSLWALGGAPGAFVRHDEQVRDRIERLVAASNRAAPLADGSAYERLIAPFSFDAVLPAESPAAPRAADAPVARGGRGAGTWRAPDGAVDSPGARALGIGDSRHDVRRSMPDAMPPHAASTRSARPWPGDAAMGRGPSGAVPAAEGDDALRGARRADAVAERVADAADARVPAPAERASPAPRTPFGATGSRNDAARPVRREIDSGIAARVATLLAAAADDARVRSVTSDATTTPTADATATESTPPVLALLARAVERVERRVAERALDRRSPRTEDDAAAIRRASGTAGATAPTMRLSRDPRGAEPTAPRATGLRGLVERADGQAMRVQRAPLLVRPNESLDDWPDGDDDRLGSALDAAARRAGVDVSEVAW